MTDRPGTPDVPSTSQSASSALPDVDLHALLSDLLADGAANGGTLNPDSFWQFAAALAQGRGIMAGLHAEGIDAGSRVNPSPRKTQDARQRRAYHVAVLLHLLPGIGRRQDQPDNSKRDGASLLPGNFNAGVVASDLLSMLENYPGARAGEGQILPTGKGGQGQLRGYARRIIVGCCISEPNGRECPLRSYETRLTRLYQRGLGKTGRTNAVARVARW